MKNITLKNILEVIKYLLIYYLSAKMICFAIPKFLHMQFRILHWESYLPLVETSKYQHVWSFFGRSYNYNLFIGLAEFLVGALVVFNRTRLIALLLSLGVCANILVLNIEFDIDFAIQHVFLDFAITVILLLPYAKDLYRFFIKLGGKFNRATPLEKMRSYKVYLPFLFVFILSVSYFVFAYNLRSTVNNEIVGAYKIVSLQLNEKEIELSKGTLGDQPMMFLEYNNHIVLSVNGELYFGYYYVNEDRMQFRFKEPAISGITSGTGTINNGGFTGLVNADAKFELIFQRISGEENYLNDLYH